MADKVYVDGATGIKRRLRDVGNGFYAEEVAVSSPADTSVPQVVAAISQNWRADFVGAAGPVDATKWVDRSVTPGNSTAALDGNGNLVITTGVGTNQERIIESVPVFSIGLLARFAFQLSQRTANQEFRFEIVSVTQQADGSYVTDDDSRASWTILGGDTVTQGRHEVGVGLTRGGVVSQSATVAILNNTTAQTIAEITFTNDEVLFSNRNIDSTALRSQEYIKTQNTPDPNKLYRLRIRAKNLAVAPASSTTLTVSFVSCTDYNETVAEIAGGRGAQQPSSSIPVNVTGTPAVTSLATSIAAPSTSGSTTAAGSLAKVVSAASTNATSTKVGATKLIAVFLGNNGAAARYLKIYNKGSAPTVGTDVPVMIFMIPAGQAVSWTPPVSPPCSTGLAWAITAGAADTDVAAVGANEVVGHLHYV